jgi:hypothetical protein
MQYLQNRINHIYRRNIIVMDNSSLSVWEECNRKFLYKVLLSLKLPQEKPALTFGKSFHKFLEYYHAGFSFENAVEQFVIVATNEKSKIKTSRADSIENGIDPEYSLEFGFMLCKKYAETHPIDREYWEPLYDHEGKAYLEMGFAVDLPNGIIIGMIDGLGIIRSSRKKIVAEHKTTKYSINSQYLSDFNPNNQVSTYLYAASELTSHQIDTALINVIRVKDYKRGDPEENVDKLFRRIEVSRTVEQLEQRMRHANFQLNQINQSIEAGLDGFPMETRSCRTKYGECEYRMLCMSGSEKMLEIMAETTFQVDVWQPYKVFEDVKQVVEINVGSKENKVIPVEEYLESKENKENNLNKLCIPP